MWRNEIRLTQELHGQLRLQEVGFDENGQVRQTTYGPLSFNGKDLNELEVLVAAFQVAKILPVVRIPW